jgi:hypothetical protein
VAVISQTTRAVYLLAIATTAGFAMIHLLRLIPLMSIANAPAILLAAALGIGLADLITGLVHWGCDTWGSDETPWLGPRLIRSFREHHREPSAMLKHDWVEVSGDSAIPVGFGFALLTLPAVGDWLVVNVGVYAMGWSLLVTSAVANQLHQWAHMPRPPALIRRLQHAGIILSTRRHAEHHRAPHLDGYCISSGWLNQLLDRSHFWRALEHAVQHATGFEPRKGRRAHR